MTEQEFGDLFDAEEESLLAELGESLRATPELELPADFARHTAAAARERFKQLSPLNRLTVALEPVLAGPVASARTFPFAVALLGVTLLSGVGMPQSVTWLGPALLFVVCLWKAAELIFLPGTHHSDWGERPLNQALFYVLPFSCVGLTSVLSGGLVSWMTLFSLNFRSISWDGLVLGPLAGLAVLLYLLSALLPTWKALRAHSLGRPRWIYPVQFGHGLVVGVLSSLLSILCDPTSPPVWNWVVVASVALTVSLALGSRSAPEEARPALWRALNKTVRSLAIGAVAIGAALVAAYELSLTGKIDQPELYQATLGEVRQWVSAQQSLAPERNGWIPLRSAMTHVGTERPPALLTQMKAGVRVYEAELHQGYLQRPGAQAKWAAARDEFVHCLPAVGLALSKPEFSPVATEGFKVQSLVPNFVASRAISQGLTGLTGDAIRRHQGEEALSYQLTNLAWSSKMMSQGSLIGLMISVAEQNLALDCVERWVFECRPNAAQLRRMLSGLQSAEFERLSFQAHMKREVYLFDRAFGELFENGRDGFEVMGYGGEGSWRLIRKLMPRSYWRSEHKAYINLMLANQSALAELGRPNDENPNELLPFSLAAREFAPMTFRAQAQFMVCLTRFKALETVVALELYRREHGQYPESLERLVPSYLPELPRNVASPKPWSHKPMLEYRSTPQDYRLIARSSVFELVKKAARQQFGPDGQYKLEELRQ